MRAAGATRTIMTNALIPIRFMTISRFVEGRGCCPVPDEGLCLIRTLYGGCDRIGAFCDSGQPERLAEEEDRGEDEGNGGARRALLIAARGRQARHEPTPSQ